MSARFLVLFPVEVTEVVMAAHVVDSLRRSHHDAWIACLTQKDLQWLSDGFQGSDITINYLKTPGEKKTEILDLVPDYLIDLSGIGKFWLFKSRLKVMDFSFTAKSLRKFQSTIDLEQKLEQYETEIHSLLSVFDLLPIERMSWDTNSQTVVEEIVPKSYFDGFASLNLDDFDDTESDSTRLTDYLSALDYYTVLVGNSNRKDLGDRLAREVGCTVFNTAGDIKGAKRKSLYAAGKVLIGSGAELITWAFITHKRSVDLALENDPQKLRLQLRTN